MTVRFQVTDGDNDWTEYDEALSVKEQEQALPYARQLVTHFNATLKPHERPRAVISAELVQDHDWHKTNLITQSGSAGLYDAYQCQRCYITGKRYGLSATIQRDKKYKSAKYDICEQ